MDSFTSPIRHHGPIYLPDFLRLGNGGLPNYCAEMLYRLEMNTPFEDRISARSECFMADGRRTYTYGVERNARTYEAVPISPEVRILMDWLNSEMGGRYNVCVLNRYGDAHQALGWHSDDSPEQDQSHPISVVSFGETREIWVRRIGDTGVVPPENRFPLEPGSLFVMPGGYQQTHQHRIPRHGAKCGLRISLTFRKLVIKYWATEGVYLKACRQISKGDGKGFWYMPVKGMSGLHKEGSDFALTYEGAKAAVHKLAAKKRASLTRQLAELDAKVEAALLVVEAVGRPLGGAASGPVAPKTEDTCADD